MREEEEPIWCAFDDNEAVTIILSAAADGSDLPLCSPCYEAFMAGKRHIGEVQEQGV